MTEGLPFHFSLSCIGEGNDNPLQYPCLENPRDRGAWWAAVPGVAKSWAGLRDFTFTFHFHTLEKEMAAAMNIRVHVTLSVLVSSVCMSSSGIDGLYGSSVSSFLRNLQIGLIVSLLVCIPTTRVRGFPFLHNFSSIYC